MSGGYERVPTDQSDSGDAQSHDIDIPDDELVISAPASTSPQRPVSTIALTSTAPSSAADTPAAAAAASGGGSASTGGAAAAVADDINPDRRLALTLIPVGGSNRAFVADSEWTVAKLKTAAFPDETKANKNIRFIFAGQLLRDGASLKESRVTPNAFIHVSISDFKPPASPAAGGDPAVVQIDADGVPGAAAAEWGLDNNGLQVARLHALQWEQNRMAAEVNQNNGTNVDFVIGFIIGIAFGVIAVLWLFLRHTPRRRKIGIVCGMMTYFTTKWIITDPSSTATPTVGAPPNGTDSMIPTGSSPRMHTVGSTSGPSPVPPELWDAAAAARANSGVLHTSDDSIGLLGSLSVVDKAPEARAPIASTETEGGTRIASGLPRDSGPPALALRVR